MINLSVVEALQIAEEYFPHGLEEVVDRLGVIVDYENLGDSDGYVLKFDDDFYITINRTQAQVRQSIHTSSRNSSHFARNNTYCWRKY